MRLSTCPAFRRATVRQAAGGHGSLAGFRIRLASSIVATCVLLSTFGYVLMSQRVERGLLDGYRLEHAAAASALAITARRGGDGEAPLDEMEELLNALSDRSGLHGLYLADARGRIRLVAGDEQPSHSARDLRTSRGGGTRVTREAGGGEFLLVAPLNAPVESPTARAERFTLVAHRDGGALDEQLAGLRRTFLLAGVLATLAGIAMFWLVGGRSLLSSHRIALQRADRDGLTDLPNHRAFREDLRRDVAVAARHGEPLAIALVDLDDFKFLNDRHGHPHGDAMLRRVAAALRGGRGGDRRYRIGGDEFALLLPSTDPAGARSAALRLTRALSDAGISASVGLGAHRDGSEADGMLAEADAALYESKRRGGRGITHFEDIRGDVAVTTPEEGRAIRRLLDEGDLSTAFQPIWDLRSGALLGLEALTRPAEHYGLQGPAHAFDLAEQAGRVRELDELCARSALNRCYELPPEALLFINLSPQTLDLDDDTGWLLDAAVRAGMPPEQIVLEVTERFGARTTTVVRSLDALRAQGFRIALDDVGTGNAGLEMLHAVGAEFVKLDRGIVAGAPTDPNARAVLLAMATFARQTGAYVIAEGIEDAELLVYVRAIDEQVARAAGAMVQGGQGFGLGRPSPELPLAGASLEALEPA